MMRSIKLAKSKAFTFPVLFVWTMAAMSMATQHYFSKVGIAPETSWWKLFFLELPSWYVWAFATPAIYLLNLRYPIYTGPWKKNLYGHLPIAIFYIFIISLFRFFYDAWIADRLVSLQLQEAGFYVVTYLVWNAGVYVFLIGILSVVQMNRQRKKLSLSRSRLLQKLTDSAAVNGGAQSSEPSMRRFAYKDKNRIKFLDLEKVAYIESEGNFVKAHLDHHFEVLNFSLKNLETMVDPSCLVRIHKSYMVNKNRVAEIESHFRGDYILHLDTGQKLKMSRNYDLDQLLH